MNGEMMAYFSMEVGISHTIPTYSGGLGVLAGDLLKSYADMKLNAVGITLLNEKGYFRQEIDSEGNQIEKPVEWNPSQRLELLPNIVTVNIEGRKVNIRAWRLMIRGFRGNSLPCLFLDTNVDGNSDYDKTLTSYLYGGDNYYRLAQEIVLGIGGVRMLDALGFHINKYHMNEGHAALLTAELLQKKNIEEIREACVFTTHTPVAAGHDKFEIDIFQRTVGGVYPSEVLEKVIYDGKVNMTLIGLLFSNYVNGVAKRHGEVTQQMFPHHAIDSITNGIHPSSWASPHLKKLFDEHIPGWKHDPYNLRYIMSVPKEKIWQAHVESKNELINYVNSKGGVFDINTFTIGCARRFTQYKRLDLILLDVNALKRIAQKYPLQVIFAGKAHMKDGSGKEMIKKIFQIIKKVNAENGNLRMIFLEDYDISLAYKMVAGCDVWLNNPQRPLEASGTSGMKAAINGVPHLSTLDGWWLEGWVENITGWSIGPHPYDQEFSEDYDMIDEALDLYAKLEDVILPKYKNKNEWLEIMRYCIAVNGSFFNSYRMAQQYIVNAYH